jgi:hypothetical protein
MRRNEPRFSRIEHGQQGQIEVEIALAEQDGGAKSAA